MSVTKRRERKESERDNSQRKISNARDSLRPRERPALELRSYDTLAINYSRIMSGPGAHCLPWDRVGGEGGEKELLHVGSFFLRRFPPFFTPYPLLGETVAPRYSAAERFYAEICGFIGNSYEGRSARTRARKLDELRTIHGIRNPRRGRDSSTSCIQRRISPAYTPPARIIKHARRDHIIFSTRWSWP